MMVGTILSTMPFVSILASYLVGRYFHLIGGRQPVILVGSLLIIAQLLGLGYLDREDDT